LVEAHVGRGTFVSGLRNADDSSGLIDLSTNTAPIDFGALSSVMQQAMGKRSVLPGVFDYQPPPGRDAERKAAAAWIARTAHFPDVDWNNLITTAGAQNGLAVVFSSLCRPGDTVLCESMTFPGMRLLASQLGLTLRGVAMDEEGMQPDAIERSVRETGAKVIYVLPTLQNPTARTLGAERRGEIAAIARRYDLRIVEDDIYAPCAAPQVPPIAALAPERTFYVTSLSKIVSPGLRAGYLVAPRGEMFDRCLRSFRALMHSPCGLSGAVAAHLFETAAVDEVAVRIRTEMAHRVAFALDRLTGFAAKPGSPSSLHLWIPCPQADRVASQLFGEGVRVSPSSAFEAGGAQAESGLRLCVGAAASRAALEKALGIVRSVLGAAPGHMMQTAL
jgi:DNA-binding transcriptional MocR family regulator